MGCGKKIKRVGTAAATGGFSEVANIMKPGEMPKAPIAQKVAMPDEEALLKAARRKRSRAGGRASTVLSFTDGLGG